MNRLGVCTREMWKRSLALAFFAVVMLPALAWSQVDSTTSTTTTQSSEATTEATRTVTTEYLYDWRVWAAVGAVLLVILIIAVSRGRGDSSTTVIK